jgi:hypothetical protein
MPDELLDVGDVVVQAERALGRRYHARVDPVGDVDLVVAQQRAHGVAQQRGMVAGHRGDDQHHRVVLHLVDGGRVVAEALETLQLAERLGQRHALDHRDLLIVRDGGVDAEFGFLVVLAEPMDQLVTGSHPLRAGQLRERTAVVIEHLRIGLREVAQRAEERALPFVDLIKHRSGDSRRDESHLSAVFPSRVAMPQ